MRKKTIITDTLKVLALSCILVLSSCDKDDDPNNYQTPLPEATQTGVGMFACYVDGKAYIATDDDVTAYYQYYMGKYGMSLGGSWKSSSNYIWTVYLESSSPDEFIEGVTYDLKKSSITDEHTYYGGIFFNDIGDGISTNDEYTGELTITKYDYFTNILSGTFWFDVQRADGTVVQVRDGRFDVHFAG